MLFKKKKEEIRNHKIVAVANGEIIAVNKIEDSIFSAEILGPTIGFRLDDDVKTIVAPISGTLTALFPTGHAFGITRDDGVEVLVHIGINTVNANGEGFKIHKLKQGDHIKQGQSIVDIDLKKLLQEYDMTTMIVITNNKGKELKRKNLDKFSQNDVLAVIE